MSHQIMNIGPVPTEENAAQVGSADYDEQSRRECRVFLRMLERLYPIPEDTPASLVVKSFPHDFGSYREVCVRYDESHPEAVEYAFELESDTPAQWDAIARYELLWLARQERLSQAVRSGRMAAADLPERYRSGEFPRLPEDYTLAQLLEAFPL